MQLQEALRRYVVQLQADGRSQHTIKQYQRHVYLLDRWLDENRRSRGIAAIDHETLAEFLVSDMATKRPDGQPKRATSMNCLRSSLRTFFAYLHAAGYTTRNAGRLIRLARCGPPPPRALSVEDQRKLMATLAHADDPIGQRDHALFALMLATGIRVGSAVAIDVEDVDLDAGRILLRSRKGDRPVLVALPNAVQGQLRELVGKRRSGPVFTAAGHAIGVRTAQRRFSIWARRAGVRGNASLHSLRHSRGVEVYESTQDLRAVMTALGHRSIASSLTYVQSGR